MGEEMSLVRPKDEAKPPQTSLDVHSGTSHHLISQVCTRWYLIHKFQLVVHKSTSVQALTNQNEEIILHFQDADSVLTDCFVHC